MTRKGKLLIAAGLIAVSGIAVISGVSSARDNWQAGHRSGFGAGDHQGYHAGRHGGRHHGKRLERMLERFDADGDGTLTQTEIDEGRKANLAAFDRNGDGALSLDEFEPLWLDFMRERMVDRFQDLDADGDAIVTQDEFREPFEALVERLDRDGDGALSREDRRGRHMGKRSRRDADD